MKANSIYKYYNCVRIPIFGILMLCIFVSCGSKNQEYVDLPFDRETTPSMRDDSVTMFISDSGIIRYKMIADEWFFYDKASDPHWHFPKGIYVEQFDTLHTKQASIEADTAWNYYQRKLWKFKGHVLMKNIKGETFKTEEFFWDEKQQKIYSDKYIEIYRPEKLTLQGVGFESNINMTRYRIFKPFDSDIIVTDDQNKIPSDSI